MFDTPLVFVPCLYVKLIGPWETWKYFQKHIFQASFTNGYLEVFLWNWSSVSASEPHWWQVNIGSGNGLVPSSTKPRASENIFRLQCKSGSSKWASPHHKQFATFLCNFYIFKQLLGNFEIWASVRRTQRTLFSDALTKPLPEPMLTKICDPISTLYIYIYIYIQDEYFVQWSCFELRISFAIIVLL